MLGGVWGLRVGGGGELGRLNWVGLCVGLEWGIVEGVCEVW